MSEGSEAWRRACLALDLLAVDPGGLGGIALRARAGPVRDIWLSALRARAGEVRRLHPLMPDEAFFGGVDVAGSLAAGALVETRGAMGEADTVILANAERCAPALAARLAVSCDGGPALVVLDEGADEGERAPPALTDRLALHVSLDGIGRLAAMPPPVRAVVSRTAEAGDKALAALVTLSHALGVDGVRAPLLALRAARAHAALAGRARVEDADLAAAAELVLAPRATRMPEPVPEPEAEPPAPERGDADGEDGEADAMSDMVVEAARAAIPPDVLDALSSGKTKGTGGGGFGAAQKGNRRGRPLPSRAGRMGGGARVDLVATLRAAAPWQALRKRGRDDNRVRIAREDIRLRRYESRSDRLVIFAVDASGSAALGRLAEAKGAVELMLGDAYARRDHVALIAFRGTGADLLLPPTRSLTQTKRRLAALPGGGGTPLAAGLMAATEVALRERQAGLSPMIALLTDGRPNVALDGTGDRAAALAEAIAAARRIAAVGIPSVVLDVSNRPSSALASLARDMRARYVPLPFATAERMAGALDTAMRDEVGA